MGRDPFPEILQNWQAVSLSGPSDSTAIGVYTHLSSKPEHLEILSSAARSAAAPASLAVAATYEYIRPWQARGLPPFQGTNNNNNIIIIIIMHI